nr:MAG TPA: hypothetical protein [Caudoviricetes sp.]
MIVPSIYYRYILHNCYDNLYKLRVLDFLHKFDRI